MSAPPSQPHDPQEPGARPLLERFWVLVRSGLVGLAATAADLGTLCLLIYVFGMDQHAANVPSLLPGLVVIFLGNKFFAFQDRSKHVVRQGSLFLAIEAVAFALNVGLYSLILWLFEVHPVVARLLGTNITYLCFSFPLWSLLVFRYRRGQEAAR